MWRFRAEDELTERLTRKDFLKVAGTGTAGLALLGASAATSGCSYLPEGGSKVNVVVIIVDSLRRDHVGAYGNSWIKTPNLDALGQESHPYRGEDLALQGLAPRKRRRLQALRVVPGPRGSDRPCRGSIDGRHKHQHRNRQPAPVQGLIRLPAGLRHLRLHPRPGARPVPPDDVRFRRPGG